MMSFEDQRDSKDWARRVLRRAQSGESVALIAKAMAQDALGIVRPKKSASDVLLTAVDRLNKSS